MRPYPWSLGRSIPGRSSLQQVWRALFLAILFSVSNNATLAAPPQAPLSGSQIENRARVTFDLDNQSVRLDSNVVRVAVLPQESLTLTANNTQGAAAGAGVSLPHRLTNTGNVATTYALNFSNLGGDDFDLTDLKLFRDINGNGQVDLGEPQLSNGDTIVLNVGQFADLVIVGNAPASASPAQSAQVQISATSVSQNQTATNTDTINIATGIALRVLKSAVPQQATRGQEVTFTITTTSYGSASPLPIAVQVDGAPRNLVILRDEIPANTTFVSLSDPGNGIRLYHRLGAPRETYTTTAPPASEIDAVAYGLTDFATPRQSVQVQMRVRINDSASGNIHNTALFEYSNGVAPTNAPSNEVIVVTPSSLPLLRYYTNDQFNKIANATGVGTPLYLQAESAANNMDSTKIETITITIRSALTGDFINVVATETGANTGIFRTNAVPTNGGAADNSNGSLETRADDILTARIVDVNGSEATAKIAVDPFGVVFDSRTNLPIAGATVTLIDVNGTNNGGNAGGAATVFQFDGVTPAPSTVVTGADGTFQFPQVAPGTYRLQITAPAGYTFPSVVPVELLSPSRVIDVVASYGGNFTLQAGDFAQQFDVPLDAPPPSGLFVQKTALRSTAEIGEFVDYRIEIRNNSGMFLTLVQLNDILPQGFIYQTSSTRYDGVAAANPIGAPGPNLTFVLPNLIAEQKIVVTYRVKIGATVKLGRNSNRASWRGVTPVGTSVSNVASAVVDVQAGVFTTRGIIFGKVFVDANRNRIQDKGELGIPNVRIYLEDGTFSITDSEGEYSIYGVSASSHNVKLDTTTMPLGFKLGIVSNRNLGDAGSVLADLKNAEMHKVNFAETGASEAVLKEIATRRAAAKAFQSESETRVKDALTTAVPTDTPSNSRSLPASGVLGGNANNSDNFASGLGGTRGLGATGTSGTARGATLPLSNGVLAPNTSQRSVLGGNLDGQAAPPQVVAPTSSEEVMQKLLPTLNKELGFVDLKDGDTLPTNQISVRVKGASGGAFRLSVNGDTVPEARVGSRSEMEANGVAVWEYIGVRLKAGENTLVLSQVDGFGNARGSQTIKLIAPGQLGRLTSSTRSLSNAADGRSLVPITITLTDDKGVKVTSRTPVTLEATRGQWQVEDLNATEFGVQVFVEGGTATYNLLSPLEPGQVLVRATSGLLESNLRLTFVPELRPLIASGLGDLKLNLSGFRAKGAQEISSSLFDDELKGIQSGRVNGRGALFLKGRVQGKYLLTLRYDSEKASGERLFRDVQPDEFYPVYGDSSVKGFDAQSTSRLYVRVDRNQSYALFGDFTTNTLDQLESLGRNSRSLNGVQLHRETSRFSTTVYGSRDSTRQIVQEVRGRGLSGPYVLSNSDYRENSEKVEIIVRDRNQPNVILSSTPQTRFSDYEIDRLTDGLLFRRPVPALDADLNPVFIRITYEVETGGPRHNIFGANGQFKLNDNLQVGASFARDEDPLDSSTLLSLNAVARLTPNTILIAEVARSQRDGSSDGDLDKLGRHSGNGSRLELIHNDDKLQARVFMGQTSRNFDNPESVLNRGRSEISARATMKLNSSTRVAAEAIRTTDRENNQTLSGAQVSVEKAVSATLRGQFGIRYSSGDTGAGSGTQRGRDSFTSLFARATKQVGKKANLFARYERQLTGDQQSLAIGGDYQIADRTRLYLTHEFLDSLDGLYALNEDDRRYNTRFGIESDYMKNGSAYSEYRIGNGIDGRSAQAAIGLRNLWTLRPGLRVNTNFERIRGSSTRSADNNASARDDNSTSAGVGIEYLSNEKLKATARIEKRSGRQSNGFLQTFGVAYKPSTDLTVLARNIYSTTNGEDLDRAQDRFQIGLAYRQAEVDKLNALLKYEYRYDKNGLGLGANSRRGVHILSGDLNYQPSATLTTSLHGAWKNARENSLGLSSKASAQLLSGRVTKELSRKLDLSLIGSRLWDSDGGSQYGLGAELGFVLRRNLLLGVGYNFAGLSDRDLLEENLSRRGFYLRLRFKFDESALRGLEGKQASVIDDSPGFTPITAQNSGPVLSSGNDLFGAAPGQLSRD